MCRTYSCTQNINIGQVEQPWQDIKLRVRVANILHDMGRTATTGEFKDGSFKIKLITSDKVSKYSVYFKDKKFELGKLTFNFCRETYSIPE